MRSRQLRQASLAPTRDRGVASTYWEEASRRPACVRVRVSEEDFHGKSLASPTLAFHLHSPHAQSGWRAYIAREGEHTRSPNSIHSPLSLASSIRVKMSSLSADIQCLASCGTFPATLWLFHSTLTRPFGVCSRRCISSASSSVGSISANG